MQTTTAALSVVQIARVCHEANKAYCFSIGDTSQKSWEEAEQWQRDSAIAGVQYRLDNPDAPASAQHESWMKAKEQAGWSYGPIKDPENKQHPCMVSYEELPEEDRRKDALFQAVVDSLAGNNSVVVISKRAHDSLVKSEAKLNALEAGGVDNWSGYSEALATMEDNSEETQGQECNSPCRMMTGRVGSPSPGPPVKYLQAGLTTCLWSPLTRKKVIRQHPPVYLDRLSGDYEKDMEKSLSP